MKSTRDRILKTLLTNPRSTINKLAQAVDINAISVRHHLASLQADALVVSEEERHGVGRPRLVYSLTELGVEKFPTRYVSLSNRILDQINNTLPESVVENLFERIADSMLEEYKVQAEGLSVEEKIELLNEALAGEGFSVTWTRKGNEYHIISTTCPYHKLSRKHPEVCLLDKMLISKFLSLPANQVRSIAKGEPVCHYIVVEDKES